MKPREFRTKLDERIKLHYDEDEIADAIEIVENLIANYSQVGKPEMIEKVIIHLQTINNLRDEYRKELVSPTMFFLNLTSSLKSIRLAVRED